jgi:hypothetical protein
LRFHNSIVLLSSLEHKLGGKKRYTYCIDELHGRARIGDGQ